MRRTGALFQPLYGLQHLLDMVGNLNLPPGAADNTLAVDQKSRAVDAHIFFPVHALLGPDTIGLASLAVLVGGEREGELVLRFELVMARGGVARDANHSRLE